MKKIIFPMHNPEIIIKDKAIISGDGVQKENHIGLGLGLGLGYNRSFSGFGYIFSCTWAELCT